MELNLGRPLAVSGCMRHTRLSPGLSAALLMLSSSMAAAQPMVVDLRSPKPRAVQSTVFTIDAPQAVRVEAIGAESESRSGAFSWLTTMWTARDDNREPWMGDAWILDLESRKVVWELSRADTERGRRGTRIFNGSVQLPAGTYEAFYAAYPNTYWTDENGNAGSGQRFLNWLTDVGFDQFHLAVHGNARRLEGADADRARRRLEQGTVIALRGDGPGRFRQAGFSLERPTRLEILAEGEVREDAQFDSGWIINVDTRETVWKLNWRDSSAAGGAAKNRIARTTTTLPAGRYAAFYVTDDSHDAAEWNSAPPVDPYAWGMFVRADEAARAGVKAFPYEHVPAAATLAALTRIGDEESSSKRFTLNRASDVRVYAIGEGSRGRLVDYAWITNASGRTVWEMRYDETQHAGGDQKNRLVDRLIHLERGEYEVHYKSDDSHSYRDWNAAAPYDAAHWGVTVLTVGG